jgi:hypothetical protein
MSALQAFEIACIFQGVYAAFRRTARAVAQEIPAIQAARKCARQAKRLLDRKIYNVIDFHYNDLETGRTT